MPFRKINRKTIRTKDSGRVLCIQEDIMKHIVLTGGGTAGHVTPNIAMIPALKEQGFTISYIGSYFG